MLKSQGPQSQGLCGCGGGKGNLKTDGHLELYTVSSTQVALTIAIRSSQHVLVYSVPGGQQSSVSWWQGFDVHQTRRLQGSTNVVWESQPRGCQQSQRALDMVQGGGKMGYMSVLISLIMRFIIPWSPRTASLCAAGACCDGC
jgi:hypothetical protein